MQNKNESATIDKLIKLVLKNNLLLAESITLIKKSIAK